MGSQTTALCRFKQVLDLNIAAGGNATYAWSPAALASGNAFQFCTSGVTTTNLADPYNSTSAAGYTPAGFAGPFAVVDPSLEYRVVRASMRITPTTTVTQMSGIQHHTYAPTVYIGGTGSANLVAIPPGVPGVAWTKSAFENFEIFKAFNGFESVMIQWFPSDDEINIESRAYYGTNDTSLSGFVGYFQAATGVSTSYHIELDYGIEYVPNTSYRPYVERKLPSTHPNAFYFLSQEIGQHWDQLVIQTVTQYDRNTAIIDHKPSSWTSSYQLGNQVSTPSLFTPSLRKAHMEAEFLEEVEDYQICNEINKMTGLDVCGGVRNTAYAVGKGIMKAGMNAYTHNPGNFLTN